MVQARGCRFVQLPARRIVTRGTHGKGGTGVSENRDGLPPWLTATVVLVLLALLGYNLVVYGPDGYPLSVILGGLLGAYGGVAELIKRRKE